MQLADGTVDEVRGPEDVGHVLAFTQGVDGRDIAALRADVKVATRRQPEPPRV